MKKQNLRRQPRHDIGVHAAVITPEATIPVYATDISVNGLCVESSESILPETLVAVSLAIGEETLLSGQILWTLARQRSGQIYYQMGIAIQAIILKDLEAIGFPRKATLVQEILSRINGTTSI